MTSTCETCRKCFDETRPDDKYSAVIDRTHADCACEQFRISIYSPGPVSPAEKLYRMIILPGDFDLLEQLTFEAVKSTYKNGLSVFREQATEADIISLAEDRMYVTAKQKRRSVNALIELSADEIRKLLHGEIGAPFCIYDQTVPRKFDKSAPHVPTHAGIFQRFLPAETVDKSQKTREACEVLWGHMKNPGRWIKAEAFRGGFLAPINQASADGKYTYESPPKS